MKKRALALLLAMIILLSVPMEGGIAIAAALPGNSEENTNLRGRSSAYGPFKNVTHKVTLDPGHEELCKRTMTGEVIFDWPEPSTFVDVVFIQDFSGSFDETIGDVGTAIKTMIDALNMGTDVDRRSPKDRAMIVTFQGADYYGEVGEGRLSIAEAGNFNIQRVCPLTSNSGSIKNWVSTYYTSDYTNAGTPTVDGMAEGAALYREQTNNSSRYNMSQYTVMDSETGEERNRSRKTVYVLITDGAANTAKWNNLPQRAKDALGLRDNQIPNRLKNKAVLWSDYRKQPDGTYYYADGTVMRTEAYGAMLEGMKFLAESFRSSGGPQKPEGGFANATVVTAFWEDRSEDSTLNHVPGYGDGWDRTMKAKITDALKEMSGNNPDYYATADTNIHDFTKALIKSFKAAATQIFDQVNVAGNLNLSATEYTLLKKNSNGGYTTVNPGDQSSMEDNTIVVDMSDLEKGSYKLIYKYKEDVFLGGEGVYSPASVGLVFEGEEQKVGETSQDPNYVSVPKNPLTTCGITLNKKASLEKENPEAGGTFQNLLKKRQSFYFNTKYTFTKKVQDAVGENGLVIQDLVDDRLQIEDVWLVPTVSTGVDGVSGATVKTPAITIDHDTNTVTYSLPEKPYAPEGYVGTEFPYGGYEGMEYVLVVKAKVKDSVTDVQIQEMHGNDPSDDRPLGIPNISELLISTEAGVETVSSNKVKVLPPMTEAPTRIEKFVKTDLTGDWSRINGDLGSVGETFRYSIDVSMPEDTGGYTKVVIEDLLKEVLTFGEGTDEDPAYQVLYGPLDEHYDIVNPRVLEEDQYHLVRDVESGKLTLTLTNTEILHDLAGKTLSVEFDAKIKENADLTSYYEEGNHVFTIPNYGKVKVNDLTPKTSNTVTVKYVPKGISLYKYTGNNEEIPLSGTRFDLYEGENTTPFKTLITGEDGRASVEGLKPGKTYKVRETEAPAGFVPDTATYWVITINNRGEATVVLYENGAEEGVAIAGGEIKVKNEKPVTPTPEKSLKGEGGTFFKPKADHPYLMKSYDETITYEIKVPVTSTAGWTSVEITDSVDPNFVPHWTTFKATTVGGEGEEVEIPGVLNTANRSFTWTKTANFDRIKDFIYIRFEGKIDKENIEKFFENGKDGVFLNRGSFRLNGESPKDTNEVAAKLTRGKSSIKKTIQDGGTEPVALPEGMTARFTLYKVVGNPDPGSNPKEQNDKIVATNIVVQGPSETVTDNLDPGRYYYLEDSPPRGYLKESGIIGPFGILATGGTLEVQSFEANNVKAEDPNIDKLVKGDSRPEFSTEEYPLEVGEIWTYAIDVNIPENPEGVNYLVVDDIPECLLIQSLPLMYSNRTGEMIREEDADSWLTIPGPYGEHPNRIVLEIPGEEVTNYSGKTLRIQVDVKVKQGHNLLNDGVLENGRLPNRAKLYKETLEEPIDEATVNVIPVILRNVEFTKMFGTKALKGAEFTLYGYVEGSDALGEPVTETFGTGIYQATTGTNGKILFENVPAGKYWLVETEVGGEPVLPYGKILVEVSQDYSILNGGEGSVVFRKPDGELMTKEAEKKVWNNRPVTVAVEKEWQGPKDGRPDTVKVALYRKIGEEGEPEKLAEAILKEENNWRHTFKNEDGDPVNKRYWVYDLNSHEPYIYYVEELDLPDGFTCDLRMEELGNGSGNYRAVMTNTRKTATLRLIKRDGDTAKALSGAVFRLSHGTSSVLATSDDRGIVEFKDLLTDVSYQLTEMRTSEGYIGSGAHAMVTLHEDGTATFVGDKTYPPVTVGQGEGALEAYEVKNYKMPKGEKRVNGVEEYALLDYAEEFTYTISVPLKSTEDIVTLKVKDTVEPVLGIIPGSPKVKVGEEDKTADFTYEIIGRDITFKGISPKINAYANQTLVFTFKARITASPDRVAELYPDGKIPNKGIVSINNPTNSTETNVVNVLTNYYEVILQKKLQGVGETVENAGGTKKAVFELYLQRGVWDDDGTRPPEDKEDIMLGTFTTDERGQIKWTKLGKGTYRLVEVQAPEGYVKAQKKEFALPGNHGEPLTFEMVNDHVELPQVTKSVKGSEAADLLKDSYDLSTWQDFFYYVVDIKFPDTANYSNVIFEDLLPRGIVIDSEEDVDVEIGMPGDVFSLDPHPPAVHEEWVKPKLKEEGQRQRLYVDSKDHEGQVSTSAVVGLLKGRVLRFTYKAHLKEGFNDIAQFETDEQGYIVNTASLTINKSFTMEDTAKVKPKDQYSVRIQKISDIREGGEALPLGGAVFKLEQYRLEFGNEVLEGPAIPPEIPTTYTTDEDGFFEIPKRLTPGSYTLKEINPPITYKDSQGNVHPANFTKIFYAFELQVGMGIPVRLIGYLGDPEHPAVQQIYPKGNPGPEDPAYPEIVNRETLLIPVQKVWEDENDKDGLRPSTITLTLKRAVVNGTPDRIGEDGNLTPVTSDLPDDVDRNFEKTAVWEVTSKAYVFEGEDLYRNREDGKVYNYYVLEEVPDGYKAIYEEVESGSIIANPKPGTTEHAVKITNTLRNSKEFYLQKVGIDKDGNEVNLKGAKFRLRYTNDGALYTQTITSGDGPKVSLGKLAPGRTYTLEEVEAPKGYKKDRTLYSIVVSDTGKVRVTKPEEREDGTTEDVEVTAPQFVFTEGTTGNNSVSGSYTLKVTNLLPDKPIPDKKVNGEEEIELTNIDEIFTYTVSTEVESVEGVLSFTIEDTLNDVLEFYGPDNITVTADGRDVKGKGNLTLQGQKIAFTMEDNFSEIENRLVCLTFQGKVKEEYRTIPALEEAMAQSNITYIGNKAKVGFNDDPKETKEVKIHLPEGSVVLKKTVDGQPLGKGQRATFQLLKQEGQEQNYERDGKVTVDGISQWTVSDEQGVTIKHLAPGKYYFEEVVAPAGYQRGFTETFTITENQRTPIVLNFDNVPTEDPEPLKEVTQGEETSSTGIQLEKATDPFTYTVTVAVPENVNGWTEFTVKDPVDKDLEVTNVQVKVQNQLYTLTAKGNADVFTLDEENIITFQMRGEKIGSLAGKNVVLTFDAKIKDLESYLTNHREALGVSENKTHVFTGNDIFDSNVVTVTPSEDVPDPKKTVNDEENVIITNLDEVFTYKVTFQVPENPGDLRKAVLSDTLDPALIYEEGSAKVYVAGEEDEGLTGRIEVSSKAPKTLTLTLESPGDNFFHWAGKAITLEYRTGVNREADLSQYLDERIHNKAKLKMNNEPTLETNDTTIGLGEGAVQLEKRVHGQPLGEGQSATFRLYRKGVPKDLKVTVNGKDSWTATGAEPIKIRNLLPGFYYFVETRAPEGYAKGKTEVFEITRDAVETVKITFNNEPIDIPDPEKTVREGSKVTKELLELTKGDASFTYTVTSKIPEDVSDWTKYELKDPVDGDLNVSNITMKVGNERVTEGVTFEETTNTIFYKVQGREKLEAMAGKTVTLTFDAVIGDLEQFLENHQDAMAKNKATVDVGNSFHESNEVEITPPKKVPDPKKTVNDEENVIITNLDEVFTYKVTFQVPENPGDLRKAVLSDTLDPALIYEEGSAKVYVAGEEDEGLTGRIEVSSKAPKTLTLTLESPGDNFFHWAGKTITLVFDTKVDHSKDLSKYLGEVIHNKATLTINDEVSQDTNDTTIGFGDGEVILIKTVNGRPLGEEDSAMFRLCKKEGDQRTVIPVAGEETFTLDHEKDRIHIKNLLPGIYYFEEVKAPLGYRKGNTEEFAIVKHAPETVVLAFDNAPLDTPDPKKTVTVGEGTPGTEGILTDPYGPFTYEVTTEIPEDTSNWKKFVLEDPVDDNLQVLEVLLNGQGAEGLTFDAPTNTVTYVLSDRGAIDNLAGKTLVLTIKVQLKDPDGYLAAHPERVIGNEATVDIGNGLKKSNEVTVKIPEGGGVILIKTVNGKGLEEGQRATFVLKKSVPSGEDEIVTVAGVNEWTVDHEKDRIVIENLPSGSYYFEEILAPTGYQKGRTELFKIEAGTEVPVTILFDNLPVKIPKPEKTVAEGETETDGRLLLSKGDRLFTYKVRTEIPEDISHWRKFTLTDPVDPDIQVSNIRLMAGTSDESADVVWDPATNVITYEVSHRDHLDALAGKTLILTFDGKIKDMETFLAHHPGAVAGNTAKVVVDNSAVESNEVEIVPPGEIPDLEKKVHGQEEFAITNLETPIPFTLEITVPKNQRDITRISLLDPLPSFFLLQGEPVVTVDKGEEDPALQVLAQGALTWKENEVALNLSGRDAEKFAGAVITISFTVKVDPESDYSDHLVKGALENTATLTYGDDPWQVVEDRAQVVPPEFRNLCVHKTWVTKPGESSECRKAVFKLVADGVETGDILELAGNDTGGFEHLPVRDDQGNIIKYTVAEEVPEGYDVIIGGNDRCGYTFTNVPKDFLGLVISKIDRDTGEVLRGAVFEVYLLEEEAIEEPPVEGTRPEEEQLEEKGEKAKETQGEESPGEEEEKGKDAETSEEKSEGGKAEKKAIKEKFELAKGLLLQRRTYLETLRTYYGDLKKALETQESGKGEGPVEAPREEVKEPFEGSLYAEDLMGQRLKIQELEIAVTRAEETLQGKETYLEEYRGYLEALLENQKISEKTLGEEISESEEESLEEKGSGSLGIGSSAGIEEQILEAREELKSIERERIALEEELQRLQGELEEALGELDLLKETLNQKTEEATSPVPSEIPEEAAEEETSKEREVALRKLEEQLLKALEEAEVEEELLEDLKSKDDPFPDLLFPILDREGIPEEILKEYMELRFQWEVDNRTVDEEVRRASIEEAAQVLSNIDGELLSLAEELEVLQKEFSDTVLHLNKSMAEADYDSGIRKMEVLMENEWEEDVKEILKGMVQGEQEETLESIEGEGEEPLKEQSKGEKPEEGKGGAKAEGCKNCQGPEGEEKPEPTITKTLVGTYTTDGNGLIILEGMKAGKYLIVEKRAPKGYKLEETTLEVHVEYDHGRPNVVVVDNEKLESEIPDEPHQPDKPDGTGGEGEKPYSCPIPYPVPQPYPIPTPLPTPVPAVVVPQSVPQPIPKPVPVPVTDTRPSSPGVKPVEQIPAPVEETKKPVYKPVSKPIEGKRPVSSWSRSPKTYDPGLAGSITIGGLAFLGLVYIQWKKRQKNQ